MAVAILGALLRRPDQSWDEEQKVKPYCPVAGPATGGSRLIEAGLVVLAGITGASRFPFLIDSCRSGSAHGARDPGVFPPAFVVEMLKLGEQRMEGSGKTRKGNR